MNRKGAIIFNFEGGIKTAVRWVGINLCTVPTKDKIKFVDCYLPAAIAMAASRCDLFYLPKQLYNDIPKTDLYLINQLSMELESPIYHQFILFGFQTSGNLIQPKNIAIIDFEVVLTW